MLKSWSIENFKPIVNSGELKLAPVTVLAGRNSSGKSSLLQSILMIAQTLSNPLPERALLPNERIVQLGTFEDILSDFSGSRILRVGFKIDLEKDQLGPLTTQKITSLNRTFDVTSAAFSASFSNVNSESTFSSAVEAANVILENTFLEFECKYRSVLEDVESDIVFLNEEAIRSKFNFLLQRLSNDEINQFLQDVTPNSHSLVPYTGKQPNYLGELVTDEAGNRGPYLVALSHFLPNHLIGKFKIAERLRQLLMSMLNFLFDSEIIHNDDDLANEFQGLSEIIDFDAEIPEKLISYVHDFCLEQKIIENFPCKTLRDLIVWLRYLKTDDKKMAFSSRIQEMIADDILQKISVKDSKVIYGLETAVNDPYIANIEQAMKQIARFFTSQIRYLGPIRADSATVRRTFAPSSQLDEVGDNGEYAAVVYQYNQFAQIEWYNPYTNQLEQGTLQNALDNWSQYLGVAEEVRTEMSRSMGVAWKVVIKRGQKARTLPEVGVGVGQILPVLVMGLLSPSNSLLLMEQPELHLHPTVQARLGDFFIGLSKCKKQCLIETHSENLVSQLRYHIVEAGGMENSNCMIYFVDQDEKGAARFEQIDISPEGNIINWPDGFFDETMLQEDRRTAASIKKRAAKAKNA
jgi:predicted ATPase